MKKLIFTLLISLFALNVVAQEEYTNFRYEVSSGDYIYVDDDYKRNRYNFRVKLDTQTGKMWLLIYDKIPVELYRDNSTYRKQYSINTQALPAENDQSKPGRYTFCPNSTGSPSPYFILDNVTGNVYYLLLSNTLNSWKLVPF
ncbi:MAG: hypothetical protein IKJ52_05770 [Muribaculaceae bacterium]|nr:hypothetical protein [Muribaculaceae bacterium]